MNRQWGATATLAAALSLSCGVAEAASPPNPGMIASCMVRAAAALSFNGSMYGRFGDVAVERFFGASDTAGHIPISNRTQFNIASAGKMFTAVAIGRLVDRGAVEFEAPISRYLPGLNANVGSITVAQLLNHTSGLGDYFKPPNRAAIDAAVTATDLLPLALGSPHDFPPGSKRAYSNSGFVVLGAIIEKVSGQTYAQFVQKEILTPLAMSDTRFDTAQGAQAMTRMSPEGPLEKARPAPVQAHASPAGGMTSTPSDMSLFLTALFNGHLLEPETRSTLLLARPDPGGGGNAAYGYGFNVREQAPHRVGHGGGAPGANAEVALYPDSGWQLIALSNNDPPAASRMVTVLEKALFAADPEEACATALADPELRAPLPPFHPPVSRTFPDTVARGKIIDAAIAQLNENYVDIDLAKKMATAVRARQKHGDYDSALSGDRFAEMLTTDFRAVSHDMHLRVVFSPARSSGNDPAPGPAEMLQHRKELERANCHFERVEILPRNVGYLKFNAFGDPEICAPTAVASMEFLANVDALIVDLRDNGGGHPEMVALLSSYLFAEPTHLNDLWTRKGESTRQFWTLPYVPGKRLADKPVFVLTSARSFSGAEEFSYNLKNLKRATLVGETTGGGAHPVAPRPLDEHFTILVPYAKAINPLSKTNWEGVGVEPDVKVAAADALATAQKLAGEWLSGK